MEAATLPLSNRLFVVDVSLLGALYLYYCVSSFVSCYSLFTFVGRFLWTHIGLVRGNCVVGHR